MRDLRAVHAERVPRAHPDLARPWIPRTTAARRPRDRDTGTRHRGRHAENPTAEAEIRGKIEAVRASLVYITARAEPRLDWLMDGLEAQAVPGDDLELVVIDLLGRPAREIGYRETPCVARLVESTPKPNPWQGPQRVTRRDWWAVANARNTGAVLATRDYLAFLDDRCRIGPAWLAALRRAEAERSSVIAGAYAKQEDGRRSVDHRLLKYPDGYRDCGGGWLYGCAMALPLAWLLEVNGFEEGCDGLSGEDYIFGMMLGRRGRRVDFRSEFFVEQERSAGTIHPLIRRDKGVSPHDKSHAAIARFGGRDRTEFTPDLGTLRAQIRDGARFPDLGPGPHVDWYDGQPIRDMEPPP